MLSGIPTEKHLSRLYYELACRLGAACEGLREAWPYRFKDREQLFCLAADMMRYDPRLVTILVRLLAERWRDFNPLRIRSYYPEMRTPQTIAVIAEFLLGNDIKSEEQGYILEYLQRGLSPVSLQLFFHHLYVPGGNLMQRAFEETLREYKKWGFIAREEPVIDELSRQTIGTRDASSRRNILRRLLEERGNIKLSDYIEALNGAISRQQALIDIKSMPRIERVGRNRGARWRVAV